MSFIEGTTHGPGQRLPACVDDYVAPDALVRVVDAFVASLDLTELGFSRTVAAAAVRVPAGNYVRQYRWCRPPRTGTEMIRPNRWIGRWTVTILAQ